jgi:hypothetical protein
MRECGLVVYTHEGIDLRQFWPQKSVLESSPSPADRQMPKNKFVGSIQQRRNFNSGTPFAAHPMLLSVFIYIYIPFNIFTIFCYQLSVQLL